MHEGIEANTTALGLDLLTITFIVRVYMSMYMNVCKHM